MNVSQHKVVSNENNTNNKAASRPLKERKGTVTVNYVSGSDKTRRDHNVLWFTSGSELIFKGIKFRENYLSIAIIIYKYNLLFTNRYFYIKIVVSK